MSVTASRYRSPRGNTPVSWLCGVSLTAISLVFSACGSDSAPPVRHETFAAAQADALVAAELREADSAGRARLLDSVYTAHGIDTATVRRAAEWYAERPEERARLYDDIIGRLERRGDGMKRP